jgi:hypothetical protein
MLMKHDDPCAAGVSAFFEGRWRGVKPHTTQGVTHVIISDNNSPITLCEQHFREALAAGMVTEPYLPQGDPRIPPEIRVQFD